MTAQTATALPIPPVPPVEQYGAVVARFVLGTMRHAAPLNPDGPRIVMVLTPWYRQAAAWFTVCFGAILAARAGARVEFLINDLPYPAIHPFELNEVAAWNALCSQFEAMFPTRRLSTFVAMPDAARATVINDVVQETFRVDVRHRVGSGMLAKGHAASFRNTALTPLTHIATAFDRFLTAEHPDVFFCTGGAANGTYALRLLCGIHNIRFASADSGPEALLLAGHSIAGHIIENAETVRDLRALPDVAATARAQGYEILDGKMKSAAARTDVLPPCDLLLPLGYDWDTVALGIGSLYPTQDDWMADTLDYMARRHPEADIVIRQHPHEANNPSWENVALLDRLAKLGNPRLHIMRADGRTPIYGLLRKMKACVSCQSTVVIEAQMLGLAAVCMRDTYYVASGAVTRPTTREAYYAWLDTQLTGGGTPIPQDVRDIASLDYYVGETSVWQSTIFTPHAAGLWNWLHSDPITDMRTEIMADLVRCIVADIPLATLKVRRRLGLAPLPDGVIDPVAA